jgi:hypothetical protein
VQTFQDFSVHATGFSQWLMTKFLERRIHSAKTLFAIRCLSDLPVCRPADLPISFGSVGISPFHFSCPSSHAPRPVKKVGAHCFIINHG